jgi:hypothetical protein
VALRTRHSVVGPVWVAGSSSRNAATIAPPDCVTVTVSPAIATVPVRVEPLLAATFSATEPLPLPLAPDVMVMNPALLVAVQAHEPLPLTLIVKVPPPFGALTVDGETVKLQKAGVRNVSMSENSLVVAPLVARARQYQFEAFGPRSRSSVQPVVPFPCGTPSATVVRSIGNEL